MRRREFIAGLGSITAPVVGRAQQRERVLRIGVLTNLAEDDPETVRRMAAFVQGLRELGWSDGRNRAVRLPLGPSRSRPLSQIRGVATVHFKAGFQRRHASALCCSLGSTKLRQSLTPQRAGATGGVTAIRTPKHQLRTCGADACGRRRGPGEDMAPLRASGETV